MFLGTKKPPFGGFNVNPGYELFSRGLASLVSSPLVRFTSLFGKGRGGTTLLE
jgi:hypothetical protein